MGSVLDMGNILIQENIWKFQLIIVINMILILISVLNVQIIIISRMMILIVVFTMNYILMIFVLINSKPVMGSIIY